MPTATSVATQDTWLNGATISQATNYSTDTTAFAGWVTGGAGGPKRPLLYFPIAGVLPANSTSVSLSFVPKSAPISSAASLNLYRFEQFGEEEPPIVASQATWLESETGSLWIAPGGDYGPTPVKAFTGPLSADVGTVFSIDASDVLLDIVAAQQGGVWLLFKNAAESGVTKQFSFATLEGSDAFPTLTATYEDMAIRSPIIGNFKKARIYSLMSMIVPLLTGALTSLCS